MLTRISKQEIMDRIEALKAEGKEWLSPQQVADVLGCTRSWAFEMIKAKRIKSKVDPMRGQSRPYRVVYVLDLESFAAKSWDH